MANGAEREVAKGAEKTDGFGAWLRIEICRCGGNTGQQGETEKWHLDQNLLNCWVQLWIQFVQEDLMPSLKKPLKKLPLLWWTIFEQMIEFIS